MALSDGSVLPSEKSANGRSDDITSTENYGVLSSDIDTGRGEKKHDPGGSAR